MTSTPSSTSEPDHSRGPVRIVGDVGGTNARFATVGPGGAELDRIEVLSCADHAQIDGAIAEYRSRHDLSEVAEVCLAAAGPIEHDQVDLTSNHWNFSRAGLQAALGAPLSVVNDFTAQALCIDLLAPTDLTWLGAPRPTGPGIRTVVGPGTGLGVAIQMPDGDVIPSEGGHVSFAPTSEHEIALMRTLFDRYRRLSIERVASGPGLENLYWANRHIAEVGVDGMGGGLRGGEAGVGAGRGAGVGDGVHAGGGSLGTGRGAGVDDFGEVSGAESRARSASDAAPTDREADPSAREIVEMAGEGDPIALRSIEDFFDVLASFAGDMALATWSTGGVYLSGGVLHHLRRYFDMQRFRARFSDKGRFTRFCETVPIAWIQHPYPGLLGCVAALDRGLGRSGEVTPGDGGSETGGTGAGASDQGRSQRSFSEN